MSVAMTRCHARGCAEVIHASKLMCLRHWSMVPTRIKAEIWRTYQRGQEHRRDATPQYLKAAAEACAAVAEQEARDAAAPPAAVAPAAPRDTEQLDLFGGKGGRR